MNVKMLGSTRAWTGPNGKPLRMVILDCPYDSIDNPFTRTLFGNVMALKISGYQKEHDYGTLPLDATDYVAAHLLLCEEDGETYSPVLGMKSITYRRCLTHKIDFPARNVANPKRYPIHQMAIEQYIAQANAKGDEIGYNGGWTISPEARKDKDLVKLCWDVSVALMANYYTTAKIKHIIAGATLKFKVDELKRFIGFHALTHQGEPLSPFECDIILGGEVAVMYLTQFSPEALELAARYQALWDNRLHIESKKDYWIQKKSA